MHEGVKFVLSILWEEKATFSIPSKRISSCEGAVYQLRRAPLRSRSWYSWRAGTRWGHRHRQIPVAAPAPHSSLGWVQVGSTSLWHLLTLVWHLANKLHHQARLGKASRLLLCWNVAALTTDSKIPRVFFLFYSNLQLFSSAAMGAVHTRHLPWAALGWKARFTHKSCLLVSEQFQAMKCAPAKRKLAGLKTTYKWNNDFSGALSNSMTN